MCFGRRIAQIRDDRADSQPRMLRLPCPRDPLDVLERLVADFGCGEVYQNVTQIRVGGLRARGCSNAARCNERQGGEKITLVRQDGPRSVFDMRARSQQSVHKTRSLATS